MVGAAMLWAGTQYKNRRDTQRRNTQVELLEGWVRDGVIDKSDITPEVLRRLSIDESVLKDWRSKDPVSL